MTPYEIKTESHRVALEMTIVCMRRGATTSQSPDHLKKVAIDLYRDIFITVQNFLRVEFGYST